MRMSDSDSMGFAEVRMAAGLALLMLLSTALPFADFSQENIDNGLTEAQLESLQEIDFTAGANNNDPSWSWAVKAGGASNDNGRKIATDSQGNVYVTGWFASSVSFGTFSLNSTSGNDVYVAKLNSTGSWLWVVKANGTGDEYANDIVIDTNGNVFITGYFTSSVSFGSTNLSTSGSDSYVAKLNQNGSWLWAAIAGSSTGHGNGISVDSNGDAYVTGWFTTSASFGTNSLSNGGTEDIYVAKINSTGSWKWAVKAGSTTNNDGGVGIGVGASGNIFVSGSFQASATFGSTTLASSGVFNVFVAKLTSTGSWLWAVKAGGGSYDHGGEISLDSNENIYIIGDYYSSPCVFGSYSISNAGSNDIYVAKLNSNGTWLWAKSVGSSGTDGGYGIVIDPIGGAYATGWFQSTVSFGNINLSSRGGRDIFVAKVDASGSWDWALKSGGTASDTGTGVAVDNNGNLFSTGIFSGTGYFGNTSFASSGGDDIVVAKIKTVSLWIDSIGPENGTTYGGTNITLSGGGFDTLPQYRREITVANPYSEAVENLTFDVVDPIYNETGLIASYHLDESSGTIADSSGNDYYGTTYGNSVYGVEGKVGAAMEFDGTNNNRVELQQSLNPSSISLSAWVNPSSSQNQIIVGSASGYYLALRANGTIEWHWWTSTGHYLYGSATVPTGVWSHITASYDATSGASVVYLDGQIYSQTSISPAALKNQSGKLGIGDCDSCS